MKHSNFSNYFICLPSFFSIIEVIIELFVVKGALAYGITSLEGGTSLWNHSFYRNGHNSLVTSI